MTRGEPRPVHITLIANLPPAGPGIMVPGTVTALPLSESRTSRSFSRILLEGLKPRLGVESVFFQSRGTWGGVCRARQPAQKHTRLEC